MPLRALAEPSPGSEGGRAAPPLLDVSLHSTHSSVLLGDQLRRPRHKSLPDVYAGGGCIHPQLVGWVLGFAVERTSMPRWPAVWVGPLGALSHYPGVCGACCQSQGQPGSAGGDMCVWCPGPGVPGCTPVLDLRPPEASIPSTEQG